MPDQAQAEPEHITEARTAEGAVVRDVLFDHFQDRVVYLRAALVQAEARNEALAERVTTLEAAQAAQDALSGDAADQVDPEPTSDLDAWHRGAS